VLENAMQATRPAATERSFPSAGRLLRRVALLVALVVALVVPPVVATASSPQLTVILPRGVQRGGDRELTFTGDRLGDAEEILFHSDDGFVVRSLQPVDAKSFKAVVHVPENCTLGEHIVHVRAKSGVSEYRSFWVGALPVVDEVEPNGLVEQAQAVPLNTTVHGVVQSEDVDLFAVDLTKGQRISVEVEGLRLGSHRFDPHISILDAKRFQVAAVDDSPAALQDGILSVAAPEAGRYYVQIRESSYAGDANSRYRLHIGTFPRPSAVYPAGGKAGEKVQVAFLGDAAGPIEREIDVAATGDTMKLFATDGDGPGGICPSPLPFRVSQVGNALEQEPNNDAATATTGDLGLSFNGVIQQPGDVDCFRFGAKKGQSLMVECLARQLRSGLDPVVSITRPDGRGVAANDDAKGLDSAFAFNPPEDGEYILTVKDHLGRGQPDFIYRVEILPPKGELSLSIPRIDRYSQTRQTVFVPRGNRYAVLINATRKNFDGDLVLDGSQLPAGITMTAPPMKAGRGQVPVVFEAAADAPLSGKLIAFEARQVSEQDPEGKNGVRGQFENAADFVLGDPNQAVHYSGRVRKLAAAVIDPVPFRVDIVQPKAPLVRNGVLELKVVVTRDEGFKQPVKVEFPFRSPGIGAKPSIKIEADATEGIYQLNADGKAATGTWPVYVLAQADAGGASWVASQMASIEVVEPFATVTLARSACEQGKPAQVVCTFAQARPFEGEGVARLLGLPPHTTAAELKFTKDTKDLVFDVATSAQSPVGNHKSLFVEIATPVGGEMVRMSGGGTELQIAAPAPAAAAAPPPPAAAAAPQPAAEKPLSRLEKLRQQAQSATK
jgi:hypothetical protein